MILVLLHAGWKSDASFMNQSQSEVKQHQVATSGTQLKTTQ